MQNRKKPRSTQVEDVSSDKIISTESAMLPEWEKIRESKIWETEELCVSSRKLQTTERIERDIRKTNQIKKPKESDEEEREEGKKNGNNTFKIKKRDDDK